MISYMKVIFLTILCITLPISCSSKSLTEVLEDDHGVVISETEGVKMLGQGYVKLPETTTPTPIADTGIIYNKSDNKLYFQDGAGTENVVVTSDVSGDVSIDGNLVVEGTGSDVTATIRRNDGATLEIESGVTDVTVGTTSNHPLRIITNSSNVITATTDGDVGIGTTSPTAKLDVDGDVNIVGDIVVAKTDPGEEATVNVTGSSSGTSNIAMGDEVDANKAGVFADNNSDVVSLKAGDTTQVSLDGVNNRISVGDTTDTLPGTINSGTKLLVHDTSTLDGHNGISIISGGGIGSGYLYFGNSGVENEGSITYNDTYNQFFFGMGGIGEWVMDETNMYPFTDGGNTVGTETKRIGELHSLSGDFLWRCRFQRQLRKQPPKHPGYTRQRSSVSVR